ncbi:MAG: di-trans,poly-cis-decaprenylcistransferase [Nanoarchaeota archaeon]|nr:di-trans,poly-cis-decaprenylcistransferase [Nanoarchaeota archaeon]
MVGDDKRLHIGIILDGNRRYAKKKNIVPWKGHAYGADRAKDIINWCDTLNVRELTLYTFSVENFNRPEKEKKVLFKLFRSNFKKLEKDKRIDERKIGINFIGRLHMFPNEMVEDMHRLMERTKGNKNYIVNFAMAYGGRAEIVDAVKKIAKEVKNNKISVNEIDEELVTQNLYLADEPDFIIRPGGEKRISNFLIWQSHYSEWIFVDKLWPEFTKADIIDSIDEFKSRKRRFGR